MNMDYSAYEGFEVDGKVDTVLSRGTVVVENDTVRRAQGPRPVRQARPVAVPRIVSEPNGGEGTQMNRISHWIDGKVVGGNLRPRRAPCTTRRPGSRRRRSTSPASTRSTPPSRSARAAFPAWRATSLSRRAEVMFRIRELVDANRKEIASLLTAEHGKVLSDALGEVARGLENVEFACGIPHLLKGGYSEQAATGVDVYSIRQPLGVVAGITPFNFPAMVPMWMFANALACGNTFVLKPSEKDPSASMLLAELLASRPACPPGCFNVVHGDKVAVDRILEHPDIAAVSFVGSTPIAKYIYETGTKNGKRVQALGGAKNHMLVLPDADLDMAADAAVSAGYGSAGERCMAISVVLAVEAIADDARRQDRRAHPVDQGRPGHEPDNEMGPLITGEHRDKVRGYVDGAAADGATVVVDGRDDVPGRGLLPQADAARQRHARARRPTTTRSSARCSASSASTSYDEALHLINDNPYGNGVGHLHPRRRRGPPVRVRRQVGMVGVNVPIPVPVSYYSFGGWKASLFGDTHMYGPEGINFYTRGKVVTSRWPDPATSTIDLGFPQNRDDESGTGVQLRVGR